MTDLIHLLVFTANQLMIDEITFTFITYSTPKNYSSKINTPGPAPDVTIPKFSPYLFFRTPLKRIIIKKTHYIS